MIESFYTEIHTMHTLFISDLHLDEHHRDSMNYFANFLESHAKSAQAIYILGDFFELWIGDDDHTEFSEKIKRSLKKLTALGIQVYVMGGNRDFLLGKRFARASGCTLIKDFTPINLYGSKVLLTHGDALCTFDEQHMRFRKFSHNPLIKGVFAQLPLRIRKKIGHRLRKKSTLHTRTLPLNIMDVAQDSVQQQLQKHQANYMIHGHTHRPLAVDLPMADRVAKRIVLGSWERQGCYLKWWENGKQELIFFK
jgi:UDP-2,3-diacylglucosamine hydrolase